MALFYVKAHERLLHTYAIEAETAEEAEEIFKEEDESSPIDTNCLEYGVESVERVPEKDAEWAKGKKAQAERSANAHDDLLVLFEDFLTTMDDVMGGGNTVARFRDRYQGLTGKKVYIIGD